MGARTATLGPPPTCSLSNTLRSSTPVLQPLSLDASPQRDQFPLPTPSPLPRDLIHPYPIHNPLLPILRSPPPPHQPRPPFLQLSVTFHTSTVTHLPLLVFHPYFPSTNTLHRTFFVSSPPFSNRSLMQTMSYQGLQTLPCSPNPVTLPPIAIPTHPSGHPSPLRLARHSPLLPLIFHSMLARLPQSLSNHTSSVSSSIVQPRTRSSSPSLFISIAWPS